MPLDLQQIKNDQEQKLRDLLNNRPGDLQTNLNRYRDTIGSQRTAFLNNPAISGSLSNLGITPTGQPIQREGANLSQTLEGNLRKMKLSGARDIQGLNLQNQSRVIGESTQNRQSADDYGRQVQRQSQAQDFEAQQAEKDREFQLAMDAIKQDYANKGLALQDQYTNNDPLYEAAVTRALGSIAGLGAGWLASGKIIGKPTTPTDPYSNSGPANPPPGYSSGGGMSNLRPISTSDRYAQQFYPSSIGS